MNTSVVYILYNFYIQGKLQKMDLKISKKCKIKSPDFWQNYFFLESYTIELIENDNSTRESKYIRKLHAIKLHVISKNCPVHDNV